MDRLHARYPFLEAAREAVATADVSLPVLVAEGAPAVARGRERVERALTEGTVESETPDAYGVQAELLSYPIARILVSLLESDAAIEKYARAEAATAIDRILEDLDRDDELRSVGTVGIELEDVLREFDLEDAVRREAGRRTVNPARARYRIDVGPYLRLSSSDWGDRWRLVNRELADGSLPIDRDDLLRCLEEAVRDRVLEGLPFEFADDDELAAELSAEVEDLRRLLSERPRVGAIEVVAPDLFPPCMRNLIEKAERGTALSAPEEFALMAFLTGLDMSPEEVVAFCADTSLDAEAIRYQTEFLRDETGTQYPPPTCETLSAYGICHNEEDHWQVAGDPLAYYERRLEAADDVVGWRDRAEATGTTGDVDADA